MGKCLEKFILYYEELPRNWIKNRQKKIKSVVENRHSNKRRPHRRTIAGVI